MNTRQILSIPIHRLKSDPKQPRKTFFRQSLEELGQSMKVRQEQPVRVRTDGDDYVVVHGDRRLQAALIVGMPALDAILDSDSLDAATCLERQLADNAAREAIPPLEQAWAIQEWMTATGLNASEMARRIGVSPPQVSKTLKLLTLSLDIQEEVRAGRLSASAAYALAGVVDAKERDALAEEAKLGRLSRDAINRKIKRLRRKESPSQIERFSAKLGERRSFTIKGPNISMGFLVEWFAYVLEQAKRAHQDGTSLQDFARSLDVTGG